jgi:hypothetical protein
VWAGSLDDRAPGACTTEFEVSSTSRIEADAPITGDVCTCATKPPEGVCDRAAPPIRGPGG